MKILVTIIGLEPQLKNKTTAGIEGKKVYTVKGYTDYAIYPSTPLSVLLDMSYRSYCYRAKKYNGKRYQGEIYFDDEEDCKNFKDWVEARYLAIEMAKEG